MNPLYQMLMGGQQPATPRMAPAMSPIQKMNMIMQAMRNPAQFVKQQFPDIPDTMMNDPNQVLQYLQQTRNISNDQLNMLMNQFPRF